VTPDYESGYSIFNPIAGNFSSDSHKHNSYVEKPLSRQYWHLWRANSTKNNY